MNNLYPRLELQSSGFFQRLLKNEPKENAFIEINNLLAENLIKEIQLEDVEAISTKYKVNLREKFFDQLKELYERYLKKCLDDNILTDQEVADLTWLRHLLALEGHEVIEIHNTLSEEIYKKSFDEVIGKGVLEKSKDFLHELQKNLRLPDEIANKITSESRRNFIDIELGKITEDGKISPEEWEELNTIAKNLNAELNFDEASKAQFEKMKLYWLIENGDIPVKQVDINLEQNEQCFFTIPADWLENSAVTKRINYGSPGYRLKIMKGAYYRADSVKIERIKSDELQVIDSGIVYITNRRILFAGNKKNSTIQLNQILSVVPYSNGIEIEKDSGKSLVLRVTNNPDILALTLGRVINDLKK